MENIYEDIANRTNGDIYIGVVGPVRVGKSTFITKFMQNFVLPNMKNENTKAFAIDELPQSADGVGIMTTQPKFVPNEAVKIKLDDSIEANVRLIDCVGYLVPGVLGDKIDNKDRMVNTPWSSSALTFAQAAELGTKKVLAEHSTVVVLMTTDGSFGGLARSAFVGAEEQLVNELKAHKKPFTIVLNTANVQSEETKKLVNELKDKYNSSVVAVNVMEMEDRDVKNIFAGILNNFDVVSVEFNMPDWLTALPFEHPIIQEMSTELNKTLQNSNKIATFTENQALFVGSENFEPISTANVNMGTGKIVFDVVPKKNLFYDVLSSQCGINIKSDFELFSNIKELAQAKQQYDKFKFALEDVNTTGYGVVLPSVEDMEFAEPELTKQGGKWGVRLRATAPSIHLMRVDLETEVSPIVGSQEQSEELINYINSQKEQNPENVWQINMFGRSLQSMMAGGIESKINAMPIEAQKKMRKTLTRIVNEGKGGIICILL